MCCLAAPEPRLAEPLSDPDEVKAFLVRRNAERTVPHAVCRSCDWPFEPDDGGRFRRHMCYSCEVRWFDRLFARACKRLGRKKALKRLRALAK